MTHFYFETTPDAKTSKYDKIKELFRKEFEKSEFIENGSFLLLIGDHIEENYTVNEKKSTLQFQVNKLMIPNFTDREIPSRSDNEYCPSISYNQKKQLLEIYTDPFGLYFIYVAIIDKKIIIASHIRYIIELNPEFLLKLDYDAIIQFLYSHTILDNKTLFHDIKLVPYNTFLSINLGNPIDKEALVKDMLNRKIWYDFPTNYKEISNNHLDNLSSLFSKLINYYYTNKNIKLSFLLSGGLDSTLLLSYVSKENKNRTRALTFDSSLDGFEISRAQEITKILNIEHVFETVGEKDIVDYSFEHIWISEGLSYNIASVLLKLIKNNLEINHIYVDGLAGDAQFGGEFLTKIEKKSKSIKSVHELIIKSMNQFNYSFPKRDFFQITKDTKENLNFIVDKGFENQSKNMWKTNNKAMDLECLLFFSRVRLYTLGGPKSVMNFAPIAMPFYHPEIFENYIQIKPKVRKRRKIEKKILYNLNFEISKKSSTSTIWYNKFASSIFIKFGLKIVQKLEGIFGKRLIPIHSPLPYDEWLRNKGIYFEFVKKLFDDDSLIWNILDRKNTIKMFTNFMKRKKHNHKFIMHIIDLEIILRLFYDKVPISSDIEMLSDYLKLTKQFHLTKNNKF